MYRHSELVSESTIAYLPNHLDSDIRQNDVDGGFEIASNQKIKVETTGIIAVILHLKLHIPSKPQIKFERVPSIEKDLGELFCKPRSIAEQITRTDLLPQ